MEDGCGPRGGCREFEVAQEIVFDGTLLDAIVILKHAQPINMTS